jgi:hypothetical protein
MEFKLQNGDNFFMNLNSVLAGAFGRWAGEANSNNNKKAWSSFLFLFYGV